MCDAVHLPHQFLERVLRLNPTQYRSPRIYLIDGMITYVMIFGLALLEILPGGQQHLREVLHVQGLIELIHLHFLIMSSE